MFMSSLSPNFNTSSHFKCELECSVRKTSSALIKGYQNNNRNYLNYLNYAFYSNFLPKTSPDKYLHEKKVIFQKENHLYTFKCSNNSKSQDSTPNNRKNKINRNIKENQWQSIKDEEIYSLSGGWKIDPLTISSEADLETLGLPIPSTSMQRRFKEKKNDLEKKLSKNNENENSNHERMTHKKLKIMAGKFGGKKLFSPSDANVRPMMEVVRGAVFNILQSISGSSNFLPGGKWLDLYSGTGSVGIEALSRGCEFAHFVEMDPWVVSSVLMPNLEICNLSSSSQIHTTKVENFLDRVQSSGTSFVGGSFDYISVTPPYEAVIFSDLMDKIAISPLISQDTCVLVEYPLKSKDEIPEELGPLVKVRDRKYGRTHLAIYGPAWAKQ